MCLRCASQRFSDPQGRCQVTLKFEEYSMKDVQNDALRAQLAVEQKSILLDKLGGIREAFETISNALDVIGDVSHIIWGTVLR